MNQLSDFDFSALFLVVTHVILGTIAIVIISANRRPSTAIAWLLAIIFIPFIGAIAFFLVGFSRLPRARREKQREVSQSILQRTDGLDQLSHGDEWPTWLHSAAQLNLNLGALPMVGGNRIDLSDEYQGSFDAMAAEIDRATSFVHVEFFILVLDASTTGFFDALARAAARGVRVRVLADHVASLMYPQRAETEGFLRENGIEFQAMLPLRPLKGQWQRPDLRNHRKLVVIDGGVGFTGSQNLIDAQYHKKKNIERGLHWHELMIRLDGPVVRELNAVFVTDWFSETDELLPLDRSEERRVGKECPV